MKLKDKYPNLDQFFGYFNQDWDDDYATAADGVRDFLTCTQQEIVDVTRELRAFLSEFQNDQELRKAVIELGNSYEPAHDGLTVQEWLANQVLPMLEKQLAENI
jgi:hypothetical protein